MKKRVNILAVPLLLSVQNMLPQDALSFSSPGRALFSTRGVYILGYSWLCGTCSPRYQYMCSRNIECLLTKMHLAIQSVGDVFPGGA